MANFKVGDEVVLLSTMPSGNAGKETGHKKYVPHVKPGDRFTVHAMNASCAALRELPFPDGLRALLCRSCGTTDFSDYWHIQNWRLMKLDGLQEETEERNELKLEA